MTEKKNDILMILLFAVITSVAYYPIYHNGFINYDDSLYIYKNSYIRSGLTLEGIKYAFSFDNGVAYWHPLSWLSLMLDAQLWGLNPVGYHIENVIWHLLTAILLYFLLFRIIKERWFSAAVTIFFIIHPSNVESVAWAVERKHLLASFFFFASIHYYLDYTDKKKASRYILSLFMMVLGLLSKSMIVILPAILLLIDIWPLERWNLKSDGAPTSVIVIPLIIEKIPFFLLSIASTAVSIASHPPSGVATSLGNSILQVPVSYVKYLLKIFYPFEHSIYYQPQKDVSVLLSLACFILLALLAAAAIKTYKQYPMFFFGYFWFLILILPMSGLVRIGRYMEIGERFLYLAAIGIFAPCIYYSYLYFQKKVTRQILLAIYLVICIFFIRNTFLQVTNWKDSVALASTSLKADPDNGFIYYLLGKGYLEERKDSVSAETYLQKAISIDPLEPYYHADLGELYLNQAKSEKAVEHLKTAVLLEPKDPEIQNSLASAYIEAGKFDDALDLLKKILAARPEHKNALYNFGIASFKKGDFATARGYFEKIAARYPHDTDAKINLASSLIELHETDKAVKILTPLLEQQPNHIDALITMGEAREKSGDSNAAFLLYTKALTLDPNNRIAQEKLKKAGAR